MNESMPARPKKILIVTAHPEPLSLTNALASFAAQELRAAGHEVRVSDLYAMKWKAAVDADDFPDHPADAPLRVTSASKQATREGRLSADVAAEQEKVRWSDAVILHFPMWWFSTPAIMKGWIDRVFTSGFGYGPQLPTPYGEGAVLGGRRALLSVTLGARESSFSDRGIHGPLEEVLHPLQHGLFWFTGMEPLEPFAVYSADELSPDRFEEAEAAYGERLAGLFTDGPVPYRSLAGGGYDRAMRLLPGTEEPGTSGVGMHTGPRGTASGPVHATPSK
ncbi:NAD(P)H-dependent oxidoreductase [Streptomyces sp. NPDC006512]|uniref:NAD(P)H-dependent oxidoreductase n=1 Tax=Streptomyces sp. NPDC006512 TaxID=3154307 RepID=UPI0033B7ADB5